MTAGLAIVFLAAACLALGYVLLRALIPPGEAFDGDWLALIVASLILGLTIIGWLGLVLAELGIFSAGGLALLWVVALAAGLFVLGRRDGRRALLRPQLSPAPGAKGQSRLRVPGWLQAAALIAWLAAAAWLFFRPHEFILGAADAGVYVNLAAHIAESGGIVEYDQTLAQIEPALKTTLLRPLPGDGPEVAIAPAYLFPAFFVTDSAAGEITPQFFHLHPLWGAVAHDLGGLGANLMMAGLWAVLASLVIYLVMRQLAGWEAAFLGLLGLSINALQLWFARYPTTEMLTQFLIWSAVWCMMLWLQNGRPRRLWALLGGLALGQVFLVRIDAYFLLAIPLAIWLWLRWTGRWRRDDWWFFIPLILLTAHSFLHALWRSRPYFYSIFGYGLDLLERNPALPLGVILLGGVGLLILSRYRDRLAGLNRYRRPLAWAAVILVLALVIYAWFLRPQLGALTNYEDWYGGNQVPAGLDRENLIRLGWYLSPLGIILATAGVCLMILKLNRQSAVVLATGLIFSLLYLWRIQANPHQVYTMRRYVPAVLPLAMIATAYLLGYLFDRPQRWPRLASLILALLWLASLAWSAQGFVDQVDYQGIRAQLDALDGQLAPGSMLLFNDQAPIATGDTLGTPLRYLYGHDVYTVRDLETLDEAALERALLGWLAEGRSVYWIGSPDPLAPLNLVLDDSFTATIRAFALEASYEYKPETPLEAIWTLDIARLEQS